jgi:aspartate/methionine/tyrosine aminotransferase
MRSTANSREQIPLNSIREIMGLAESMTDVIHLQIGEPASQTPLHIRQAARQAMEEGYTHYTTNAGLPSLREAIARRMKRDYGVDIPIHRIVVTPGAVTALHLALLAVVEAGEEVLLPDPTYPNYDAMARIQGAVPVYYPMRKENQFIPDVAEIEKLITPATKVLLINSPGNPTGAVFPEETWRELLNLAKKYDLYLVSDEIYDELVYEQKHICPLSLDEDLHDRIISIFGFSKVYAMTGWRLAYAIVPEHLFALLCKLQEPITTCASSISQKAGEAALDGPQDFVVQMQAVYRNQRDLACLILETYDLDFVKPDGAFYIMVDISSLGMEAREFAIELLNAEKVIVAPCGSFGPSGRDFIRICFAGDQQLLDEGVNRLGRFYQEKLKQKQALIR